MRYCKIALEMLMVFAICSISSGELNTKVYTLCENNLSINLTSDYRLIPDKSVDGSDGTLMQSFTIASTESKGVATLMILEAYDETMKAFGTDAIAQFMSDYMTYFTSYSSESEAEPIIGNWTAVDSQGDTVAVDIWDTKNTLLSMYGSRANLAFWSIENDRYVYLISSFDNNVTREIINTVRID